MRSLKYFLIALTFAGCAPKTQSVLYRLSGSPEMPWKIEARWHELGHQLSVVIDGTLVLYTGVNLLSGKGEAEAAYEGKKVTAKVFKSGDLFQEKMIVQIFVDGDKAAEFQF